jgi:alpha-beta hydrolase superfamily lysophospholipase
MKPHAATHQATSEVVTDEGLKLHVRTWPAQVTALADAQSTARVVLLVHGLGEHTGRYAEVAAQLSAWGWNVVGYDHRGHGRSDGPRGGLNHSDDLLRDLGRMVDWTRERYGGPLLLIGHSLGGLVASRFVAAGLEAAPPAWHRPVDALVLSSPALDPGMNAFQKSLLSVLGGVAPNLSAGNGLKPEWISHDLKVVAAYVADPLVHDRVTPRLVRFIVDAGHFVLQRASQWKLPTLLIYAGSDRCVAPAGSRAFAASAPKGVVTTQEFGPLFHEIFNEPERQEVFGTLRDWLAKRPGC